MIGIRITVNDKPVHLGVIGRTGISIASAFGAFLLGVVAFLNSLNGLDAGWFRLTAATLLIGLAVVEWVRAERLSKQRGEDWNNGWGDEDEAG